jgi:hypothetical protein
VGRSTPERNPGIAYVVSAKLQIVDEELCPGEQLKTMRGKFENSKRARVGLDNGRWDQQTTVPNVQQRGRNIIPRRCEHVFGLWHV